MLQFPITPNKAKQQAAVVGKDNKQATMTDAAVATVQATTAGPAPTAKGCKDTIVFIHGWPDTTVVWQKQVCQRAHMCARECDVM